MGLGSFTEMQTKGGWASLVAQMVKNLPAMQETGVQSLGQGNPQEKEMASPLQYSCLENSMEPNGLQSMGLQRVGHNGATNTLAFTLTFFPIHGGKGLYSVFH